MKGYVMQLQPFSVNDGEGIRTTIFMAGCPLRCKWCSNPEGFDQKPKTAFYENFVLAVGFVPPFVMYTTESTSMTPNSGQNAMDAVRALTFVRRMQKTHGGRKEVSEIVEEVKKHRLFYMQSGGGITFSGGETTMQREFLNELSETLYDMGFHLAMETCGYFDFDALKPVLQRMDLIFMDLKHMDSAKHAYFTGVGNEKILENIKRLKELSAEIVIRIPVIKGVNADAENIKASAAFVHTHLPQAKMELLPYHKFGFGKYEALGMETPDDTFAAPTENEMEELWKIITDLGVCLVDYR